MFTTLVNTLRIFICTVLMVQLMGCGTILYPERKGQKSCKIDVGICILDGIGVLFYIIPGVIAFAVDFYYGTIYLPIINSGQNVKATIKDIGQDFKSAGRDLASSMRGL
jgi:hypothetical protein